MKPLIAIISHAAGATWRQAIRETWLRDQHIDYKFILGYGAEAKNDDELLVLAPDAYIGILEKVRCACAWAHKQGYDFIFVCFTDTFVNVGRLLASGFYEHPYTGHFTHHLKGAQPIALLPDDKGRFDYASGGAGYWLDRRSMDLVARTNPEPGMTYDDLWIGSLLGLSCIAGYHDPRYGFKGTHLYDSRQITVHLSQGTGNYEPEWMYRAHEGSY